MSFNIQPTETIVQQLSSLSSGTDLLNICLTNKSIEKVCRDNKNFIVYNILYNKYTWLKPKLPFNHKINYTKFYTDMSNYTSIEKALIGSAQKGHTEIVKMLLKHDVDGYAGDEALLLALAYGHTETANLLLSENEIDWKDLLAEITIEHLKDKRTRKMILKFVNENI